MSFHLQIITPLKIIFNDEVNQVILPTPDGEITILPNHTSLISQILTGEIIIKKEDTEEFIAIDGGVVKIDKNNAAILADYARHAKDIDEKLAQEAKERAEKKLKEKLSQEHFVLAQSDLRRAIADLKTVRRRKISLSYNKENV